MEGRTACAAEQMRILLMPKAIIQVILVRLKAVMDFELSSQVRETYLMDVAVEVKKGRELPNQESCRTDRPWSLTSPKVAVPAIPAVLEIPEIWVTDLNGAQMIRTLVAQAGVDIWKWNDLGATVVIGYGKMVELTVQGGMTWLCMELPWKLFV